MQSELLKASGVYKIVCKPTGQLYIGSAAKTFRQRRDRHFTDLRNNKHHSFRLQAAWNEYGEEAFVFHPMLVCRPEDAVMYEQALLGGLKPEFNVAVNAGSLLGYKHTEEARKKIASYERTHEMRMKQSARRSVGRNPNKRKFEWSADKANCRRKLSESDVRGIRYIYDNKLATMRMIAGHYGMDHHTISDICHRYTWKAVV